MTKAQHKQLRQIMDVATIQQMSFGEVINGQSSHNLRLCYTIGNVWINESILPNGTVQRGRTIIAGEES